MGDLNYAGVYRRVRRFRSKDQRWIIKILHRWLVAFQNHDEALAVDDRISLLRKEHGLPDNFEFHFNTLNFAHRLIFLEAIASYNFFYCAVVMNKASWTGRKLQFKESLYNYACGLIFEQAKPLLNNAVVVIDESGSKKL